METVLGTLRGAMQVDGGDVELVGVQGGVVSVRLHGTCLHCPSASLTLNAGILPALKLHLPWITELIRVP